MVNNISDRTREFFGEDSGSTNTLLQYVQSLSPETISRLSKPESGEVLQVMENNIIGLLGNLPAEHFEMTVTTNRENLGRLLASAMLHGYFLRNAEQRLTLESSFGLSDYAPDAE